MHNPPQTTLRVVVAERHPVFRAGIVSTIAAQHGMAVIAEAGSFAQVLDAIPIHRPNVVVVDGGMLDRSTYEHLDSLCRTHHAAVLVVAPPWSATFASLVLQNVVRNCISRASSREELVEALHAVRDGKRALCRALMTNVGGPVQTPLTTSELSVLALAAEGLSNSAIANEMRVSLPYVIDHVRRLRKKLGARDRTHAVALGLKYGLLDIGTA
jgi:two-component system NarL family response regulator